MEVVILDDGTDKIEDLIPKNDPTLPEVRYYYVPEKMKIGAKRNYINSLCKGELITYFDDDDIHVKNRVKHSVEMLLRNPQAMVAGSSAIHVYFKHLGKIIQFGPYSQSHSTAGTWTFRRELLNYTRFDDNESVGEERYFLKNHTVPMVQLDSLQTILVVSHNHNSCDKRRMLDNPNPIMPNGQRLIQETNLTMDNFLSSPDEAPIKQFFLHDIDALLAEYDAGAPDKKPDVMQALDEIFRRQEEAKAAAAAQKPVILSLVPKAGGAPINLTLDGIVELLKTQEEQIRRLTNSILQRDQYITHQAEVIDRLQKGGRSKTDPEIPAVYGPPLPPDFSVSLS